MSGLTREQHLKLAKEDCEAEVDSLEARVAELEAERDELRTLGLLVCDYVRRCQLYGPADALRESAERFKRLASDFTPHVEPPPPSPTAGPADGEGVDAR